MLKLRPHYRRFAKVSIRWAQNESKGSTANCKCNTHPQMPLELPPVQSHWLQELLLGQKEPHRYCHLYRRAAAVVVGRIHPTAADFADQTLQNQTWLMPGDVSKESYGRWHNVCFQPQIYLQLYVSIRSGDGWKSTTLVVWLSMGGFGSRLGGETESQFVVYYILPFVKKLNNKRENYWFFFSRQNVSENSGQTSNHNPLPTQLPAPLLHRCSPQHRGSSNDCHVRYVGHRWGFPRVTGVHRCAIVDGVHHHHRPLSALHLDTPCQISPFPQCSSWMKTTLISRHVDL
jgi:hypothetical protein